MSIGGKDSSWLQLEVCREFQRQKCTRSDAECKFAHPKAHIDLQDGKVVACYDSIKDRCSRETCKYFHPPPHLKEQLLINGKNYLAMKNAMLQQMQLPLTAATTPAYLANLPASAVAAIAPANGSSPLQSPNPPNIASTANANSTANGSAAAAAAAAAVAAASAAAAAHPQSQHAQQHAAVAAAAAQQHAQQQQHLALMAAYGYHPAATAAQLTTSHLMPTMSDLHSYGLLQFQAQTPSLQLTAPQSVSCSVSAASQSLTLPNSQTAAVAAANNPMLASFLPSYLAAPNHTKPMTNVRHPPSVKLEVCRERANCKRADTDCRFAHPPPHVHTTQDGQSVVVCSNFIKNRCTRDQCRFYHPPSQLMDQVRSQLALAQQQIIAAAAAAAAAAAGQQQFINHQQMQHRAAAAAAAAAAALSNHSLPSSIGTANYASLSKKRPRESDDLLLAFAGVSPYYTIDQETYAGQNVFSNKRRL